MLWFIARTLFTRVILRAVIMDHTGRVVNKGGNNGPYRAGS